MIRHSYCTFCGYEPDDWKNIPDSPCEGCTEDLPLGLTIPVCEKDLPAPEIIYDSGDGVERSYWVGNLIS